MSWHKGKKAKKKAADAGKCWSVQWVTHLLHPIASWTNGSQTEDPGSHLAWGSQRWLDSRWRNIRALKDFFLMNIIVDRQIFYCSWEKLFETAIIYLKVITIIYINCLMRVVTVNTVGLKLLKCLHREQVPSSHMDWRLKEHYINPTSINSC